MCRNSMSSHVSSNQFGDRMGEGWKGGLSHLYADFQLRLNWSVWEYMANGQRRDVGDIDGAVVFDSTKALAEIFPQWAKFPQDIRSTRSQYFFVEFKRSCQEKTMGTRLQQFISFYRQLLDPANRDKFRINRWPKFLRDALNSSDLVLLFVFNGEDNVKVQRTMRNALGDTMRIHGRLVVTVHCSSEQLILWEEMQLKDELEAALKAERAALKAERAKNEQLRRELRDAYDAVPQPKKQRMSNT